MKPYAGTRVVIVTDREATGIIPDAAKPRTGGKSMLSVDGKKVAEAQIPKTQPFVFTADEGVDVGIDSETSIPPDYQLNLASQFVGRIVKVTAEQE